MIIFLCHGSLSSSFSIIKNTSFASPTSKLVEPCQWIMSALNYVFWGSQPSWSLNLNIFFPWYCQEVPNSNRQVITTNSLPNRYGSLIEEPVNSATWIKQKP
jgi:hypothetical protein